MTCGDLLDQLIVVILDQGLRNSTRFVQIADCMHMHISLKG